MAKLGEFNKFFVALLGIVGVFLAQEFADETWVTAAVAAIDALAVYLVPNKQPV